MAHSAPSRRYARNALRSLRGFEFFSRLPDAALEVVASHGVWVDLAAGERLQRERKGRGVEAYYLLVEGQVSVVVDHDPPPEPGPRRRRYRLKTGRDYITWFKPGDLFSDAYLQLRVASATPRIECVGQVASVLLRLEPSMLAVLLNTHQDWARAVRGGNATSRLRFHEGQLPSRRLVQDFFLRHGYSFATCMRVVQLDRCIDCGGCEKACAERHGVPRVMRFGPRLGQIAFPLNCRTCVDARCVEACPFGAIVRDEETQEISISNKCAGCGGCASACPNEAIQMIEVPYRLEDFPDPMPKVGLNHESNVSRLFMVGESSGDPLIKIAINSGWSAACEIADGLASEPTPRGARSEDGRKLYDLAVVGAGPAGLSAALCCRTRELNYIVFDKGLFSTTIQNYPKKKFVMAEPSSLKLEGELWFEDCTKEELIAKWGEIISHAQLHLHSGEEVTEVNRADDGLFDLATAKGAYRARYVIMATGTGGSPRRLGVDGETEPRVQYFLTDPDPCAGKQVLVVGGGDSAVEGAMSLADVEGTGVTLSYRRDAFSRIKVLNRQRLEEYQSEGRVRVILSSTVTALGEGSVTLKTPEGSETLDNDQVFAMLGAEAPTGFFKSAGIEILEPGSTQMAAFADSRGLRQCASKCDHCKDFDDQACLRACPTGAMQLISPRELFCEAPDDDENESFSDQPFVQGLASFREEIGERRGFPWLGLFASLLIVGVGLEAFLRHTLPGWSLSARVLGGLGRETAVVFVSGAGLGHWLGYIGTGLMALTLLYPLRTRLGWFSAVSLRLWLTVHIWVGLAGAAFVTYHTLFKLDRWAGISAWAMWLVVGSGVIGRYLYSRVQRGIGLTELEEQSLEEERVHLFEQLEGMDGRTEMFHQEEAGLTRDRSGFFRALAQMLWQDFSLGLRGFWLRRFGLRHIPDETLRRQTAQLFVERARRARTKRYLERARRLLSAWNRIHLALTVLMFGVAALHIVFSLLYKAV